MCELQSEFIVSNNIGKQIISQYAAGATIISGTGNDEYYLYGKNNTIHDAGGYDVYKFVNYTVYNEDKNDDYLIIPGEIGNNFINDTDGQGEIYFGFSGRKI